MGDTAGGYISLNSKPVPDKKGGVVAEVERCGNVDGGGVVAEPGCEYVGRRVVEPEALGHDERGVAEIRGADGFLCRKRIVVAHEHAPSVGGTQAHGVVPVDVLVVHEHGKVVDAVLKALDKVDGVAAVQAEAHVGVPVAKGPRRLRDNAKALAFAGAYVNGAGDDLVGLGKVRFGLVGEPYDLLGASAQVEALFGGYYAPAVALEQLGAQLAFQRGYLAR